MTSAPSELLLTLIPDTVADLPATHGWLLCIGKMTDSPHQQVCLYDSPGQSPDPKWLLDYPFVQVIVRGAPQGYQAAASKMREVYDVLLGIDSVDVGSDRIDGITMIGSPAFLNYDVNDRPQWSANFRMIVEPGASSLTNRTPL